MPSITRGQWLDPARSDEHLGPYLRRADYRAEPASGRGTARERGSFGLAGWFLVRYRDSHGYGRLAVRCAVPRRRTPGTVVAAGSTPAALGVSEADGGAGSGTIDTDRSAGFVTVTASGSRDESKEADGDYSRLFTLRAEHFIVTA